MPFGGKYKIDKNKSPSFLNYLNVCNCEDNKHN